MQVKRADFVMPAEEDASATLCSFHFHPDSFTNYTCHKMTGVKLVLKTDAVPTVHASIACKRPAEDEESEKARPLVRKRDVEEVIKNPIYISEILQIIIVS